MPTGVGIGTAVIGAGGALLAGDAQGDAIQNAAETSAAAARENSQLIRDIYGQNAERLDPYNEYGLEAGGALMDLLLGGRHDAGTGGAPAGGAAGAGGNNPAEDQWATGALAALQPNVGRSVWDRVNSIADPSERYSALQPLLDQGERSFLTRYERTNARPAAAPATGGGAPANSGALDAFDRFRQGTNYQWRLNEGLDARNGLLAARGGLYSGAAERSAMELGQNMASEELSNYMNLLSRQYSMGLSAASSLAGNGQGMAGSLVANNNAAASAAGNAAIAGGNAQGQMWQGIAGSLGQGLGSVFQSSFGMPSAAGSNGVYGTPNPPGGMWVG